MLDNIFMTVRVVVGIIGLLWIVGGMVGAIATGIDRQWSLMLLQALGAFVGFLLAYAAFVEMPWER